MEKLADVLHATVSDVAQAGERIGSHRASGTAVDVADQEVVQAWLTAANTLAGLSCSWPNPQFKAHGARLHHAAETLTKIIGLSSA